MTRERITEHCAWLAQWDRAYAEWAWRQYRAALPWIFTNAADAA